MAACKAAELGEVAFACATSKDCPGEQVCVAGVCADPDAAAIGDAQDATDGADAEEVGPDLGAAETRVDGDDGDSPPSDAPESSEVADSTPADAPETFEIADSTPADAPEPFEIADSAPSDAPGTFEIADSAPSDGPGTFEIADSTPSDAPETFEIADSAPSDAPETFEIADSSADDALQDSGSDGTSAADATDWAEVDAAKDVPGDPCAAQDCNDANPCTDDWCDAASGCMHANNALPCEDGKPCTAGDACKNGACAGTSETDCDDGNVCTEDSCNVNTGCVYTALAGLCDDANACTTDDFCANKVCAGTAKVCDDGLPCTTDFCTDGNCGANVIANGTQCDDGNDCTIVDTCMTGVCSGSALVCTADQCHFVGSCSGGVCSNPAKGNGIVCDDGSACTTGDTCQNGVCWGSVNCDDGEVCTDDSCVGKGCSHAKNTGSCSDDNACTSGDQCANGTCMPGKILPCDDGNVCTGDSCEAASGCKYTGMSSGACDLDACNLSGTCVSGVCKYTAGKNCDDGNPCTVDSCDASSGCVSIPLNNGGCVVDLCVLGQTCSAGKCQGGSAKVCNAADGCHDSGVCTAGTCTNPIKIDGFTCSDGDPCTTGDACVGGVCTATASVWTQTYGGTGNDDLTAMQVTGDSGFALAGNTNSKGAGSNDCWLVRTDASGNAIWDQTYGGSSNDACNALVQTPDGGFALGGQTTSKTSGNGAWLVRTDSKGALLWDRTYGSSSAGVTYALTATSDGGFAFGGFASPLVRTDSNGAVVWSQTLSGGYIMNAVLQTADGGFVWAGLTSSSGAGGYDMWLVRTDSNGSALWNSTFGGYESESAVGLAQTNDGGFALAGYNLSQNYPYPSAWLVRTDTNGNKLWDRFYGQGGFTGLVATADGGFFASGQASVGSSKTRLRLDASGNIVWSQNGDTAMAVRTVGTTGVVFAGSKSGDFQVTRADLWGSATCANSGACAGYTSATCDDGDQCTQDLCAAAAGCTHTKWPASTPCSDGNACTAGESCNASGICVGAVNTSAGSPCDDGNACTAADTCTGSVCTPGSTVTCGSNANCNPGVGCVCNGGYWGNGTDGSCSCYGTVTAVSTAKGSINVCAYDWPAWGERGISPSTFQVNGDGTVSDSQTRLQWQKSPSDMSSWTIATSTCAGLVLGGFDDWRLPTTAELESIVDYTVSGSAIDSAIFPGTLAGGFWSATWYAYDSSAAWVVSFDGGSLGNQTASKLFSSQYARCVRSSAGIAAPSTHFVLNGGGASTILDNATGLVWQQSDNATNYNFANAQAYCTNLTLGNFSSSWRAPSVRELLSIADRSVYNPAINSGMFPGTANLAYQTSTPAITFGKAWYVSFGYGGSINSSTSNSYRIRCVH